MAAPCALRKEARSTPWIQHDARLSVQAGPRTARRFQAADKANLKSNSPKTHLWVRRCSRHVFVRYAELNSKL